MQNYVIAMVSILVEVQNPVIGKIGFHFYATNPELLEEAFGFRLNSFLESSSIPAFLMGR